METKLKKNNLVQNNKIKIVYFPLTAKMTTSTLVSNLELYTNRNNR